MDAFDARQVKLMAIMSAIIDGAPHPLRELGALRPRAPVLYVGKFYGTKPFALIEITRPKV